MEYSSQIEIIRILGLNETIYQLIMASSVHWYCHLLWREEGHVLRRALDFEVEGQRKKGRPKKTWRKQVEEESMKVGLRGKTHFADQSRVLTLIRLLLG